MTRPETAGRPRVRTPTAPRGVGCCGLAEGAVGAVLLDAAGLDRLLTARSDRDAAVASASFD